MGDPTDKVKEPQSVMAWAYSMEKSIRELLLDKDAESIAKGNVLTLNLGSKTITIKEREPDKNGVQEATPSPAGEGAPSTERQHTETRRRRIPFTKMAAEIEKLLDEDLTQREVARRLGTSQASVSRIAKSVRQAREKGTQETGRTDTDNSPASDVQP